MKQCSHFHRLTWQYYGLMTPLISRGHSHLHPQPLNLCTFFRRFLQFPILPFSSGTRSPLSPPTRQHAYTPPKQERPLTPLQPPHSLSHILVPFWPHLLLPSLV
ncbi:hypothetical protein BJV74DRAFT_858229 [Russula compacta]|nr:hypothetical protein BJV74DRAFT_858229 [Russula compacta]